MTEFNVPEDVAVEDFFKNVVPKQFEETVSGADLSAMAGKEFTLQFDIEGAKYCLKILDGSKLEVVEGGIDKPMLTVALTEKFWRDSVTGKAAGGMDQFTDPEQAADLKRYQTLQATKGIMKLELKMDDGSTEKLSLTFNGEDSPEVTLKLAFADWVAMQNKEVEGQNLFMAGKLQFDGDMMFLMNLQALI